MARNPKVIFYARQNQDEPVAKGRLLERTVNQHAGWQSVVVHGRRYQLRGGMRAPFFITLSNPIPRREKRV